MSDTSHMLEMQQRNINLNAEVERLRVALELSEKALNLVSSEPGPTWCEVDEALDAIAALDIEYLNDEVENE